MIEEGKSNPQEKRPISTETKEWEPGLDTVLPIDGKELPGFKSWVNWNGFHLDRETGEGHGGYDFAAYLNEDNKVVFGLPPETKIRAVANGKIIQVLETYGGYATMITVEHGSRDSGMFSTYVHVNPLAEHGMEVKKGDVIAELYKDPGEEEGRLVHLHLRMNSGWGTRGTSITGGGLKARLDDPGVIDNSIYALNAEPQAKKNFTVPSQPDSAVETKNFKVVKVN